MSLDPDQYCHSESYHEAKTLLEDAMKPALVEAERDHTGYSKSLVELATETMLTTIFNVANDVRGGYRGLLIAAGVALQDELRFDKLSDDVEVEVVALLTDVVVRSIVDDRRGINPPG